jgi:hypothetical protein
MPIYKNADVPDPGNYRPTATLSAFSKILERIIYDQVVSFLDKHKIIYNYQFGFRKEKGPVKTSTQELRIFKVLNL